MARKSKASRKGKRAKRKAKADAPPAPTQPPPPTLKTASDRNDETLARRALEKQRRGEVPTARESSALKRIEKARDEIQRVRIYGDIPKKDWLTMSGRQARTVNEQADRYGAPLRGRSIDLTAFAKWFHDFLAANAVALASGPSELNLEGVPLADKRKLLHETTRHKRFAADRAEIDLRIARAEAIDVAEFREYWSIIRSQLSTAIDIMQRLGPTTGKGCAEIMMNALDESDKQARKVGRNGD